MACRYFREARVELLQKPVQIQTAARRAVRVQIPAAAAIHLAGAADISISKMVQRHGGLDQSLVEQSQIAAVVLPQLLPDFVRLEKLAGIEVRDALQIQRVVCVSGRAHEGAISTGIGRALLFRRPCRLPRC